MGRAEGVEGREVVPSCRRAASTRGEDGSGALLHGGQTRLPTAVQ